MLKKYLSIVFITLSASTLNYCMEQQATEEPETQGSFPFYKLPLDMRRVIMGFMPEAVKSESKDWLDFARAYRTLKFINKDFSNELTNTRILASFCSEQSFDESRKEYLIKALPIACTKEPATQLDRDIMSLTFGYSQIEDLLPVIQQIITEKTWEYLPLMPTYAQDENQAQRQLITFVHNRNSIPLATSKLFFQSLVTKFPKSEVLRKLAHDLSGSEVSMTNYNSSINVIKDSLEKGTCKKESQQLAHAICGGSEADVLNNFSEFPQNLYEADIYIYALLERGFNEVVRKIASLNTTITLMCCADAYKFGNTTGNTEFARALLAEKIDTIDLNVLPLFITLGLSTPKPDAQIVESLIRKIAQFDADSLLFLDLFQAYCNNDQEVLKRCLKELPADVRIFPILIHPFIPMLITVMLIKDDQELLALLKQEWGFVEQMIDPIISHMGQENYIKAKSEYQKLLKNSKLN